MDLVKKYTEQDLVVMSYLTNRWLSRCVGRFVQRARGVLLARFRPYAYGALTVGMPFTLDVRYIVLHGRRLKTPFFQVEACSERHIVVTFSISISSTSI